MHVILYCSRKGSSSQKCDGTVNIHICPDSGVGHDETSPQREMLT